MSTGSYADCGLKLFVHDLFLECKSASASRTSFFCDMFKYLSSRAPGHSSVLDRAAELAMTPPIVVGRAYETTFALVASYFQAYSGEIGGLGGLDRAASRLPGAKATGDMGHRL